VSDDLIGMKIAILAADGVEQSELVAPRDAVTDAGATTELVSLADGEIQAVEHDIHPRDKFRVERVIGDVDASDYDALILPGGVANPDTLRQSPEVIAFVRALMDEGKPVAAICHGPWTLVEADLVRGRTLTSYPSIRTDIRNAGGTVVDEEVVVDLGLISSRRPDDLPAFCGAIVAEFAEYGRGRGAVEVE
jgi:protease I